MAWKNWAAEPLYMEGHGPLLITSYDFEQFEYSLDHQVDVQVCLDEHLDLDVLFTVCYKHTYLGSNNSGIIVSMVREYEKKKQKTPQTNKSEPSLV